MGLEIGRRSTHRLDLRRLVGSGDRIALYTAPPLVAGVILNALFPALFEVGGPPPILRALSICLLAAGVIVWAWSVYLILTRVPRGRLITGGPYAVVKHPLYTAVALLVLPWLGFLLDTWLGAAVGLILYAGSRRFAPEEEKALAGEFGPAWAGYTRRVLMPWL